MHRESHSETPASIPNEEARGWKRITLASLSIFSREAAQRLKPEHAQAVERQMGEMAQEQGWQAEPTPYQDRSAIVHTFDNGWTIREPRYNGDAFREGELMSNCLSGDDEGLLDQIERNNRTWSHEQDRETWHTPYLRHPNSEFRYLSLRDPNNIPHITFNLDNSGIVASVFGRHNAPPKDAYRKMVMNFLHEILGDFEEYENFTGDEPGDLVAKHTQDRSCCGQTKVAADPQKEEQTEGDDLHEQQDAEVAAQQAQLKQLQQSHTFNHMVYIHKVDPEAAAELFFRSPVLLNQEHEREHYEGLIDNHLPETLIVAKASGYEPDDDEVHELYRHSDCGSWAVAHQREYPHLGLGTLWVKIPSKLRSSDDEWSEWMPYHAFTHDDTNAYDVTGTYPLEDIHLSAKAECPRCNKGDYGIHTPGESKVTLNQSLKDYLDIGFIDSETIPDGDWIKRTAPVPKTACSCGSTQFRRVIDSLRTYVKGSKDTYAYECLECLEAVE